jgi:hypothetical protein
MKTFSFPIPVPPPDLAGYIARYEKEIEHSERLSVAFGNLAAGLTNRVIGDEIRDAVAEWLTGDTRAQIEAMKAQPLPLPYRWATPEKLIELTDRRNQMQHMVDLAEQQSEKLQEIEDGPAAAMATAIQIQIQPFKDQIKDIEQEISRIQVELESEASAADSRAVEREEVK